MLTEEEKIIVKQLKAEGFNTNDISAHLGAQRLGAQSSIDKSRLQTLRKNQTSEKPISNRIAEGLGLGSAVDVFGSALARRGIGTDVSTDITKQYIEEPTGKQMAGALLQTAAIPAGIALTGGSSLAGQMVAGAGLGYLYDVGSDLSEGKSGTEALEPGIGTVTGIIAPPLVRGAVSTIRQATGLVSQGLRVGSNAIPTPSIPVPEGLKQVGTELAERVPRAISKVGESLEEAAQRRTRIESAPPVVQNAIKAEVDDVLITAVEEADAPTKEAYRKMVQIAESPRTGLRPAVRPESVAGDAVAEQYKILDSKRRSVGEQIGDAVDKLSTKGAIDVLPAQRGMRQLLFSNGIKPDISGRLVFDGSPLTPKQQTLVQQLYDLATQTEQMTPRQVYNMDKLFSQLQREARFDGLDNLYLSTPEGDINAFRAFRNIFSNELDRIAPEIKPLNQQYAQLRNLQDDIEGSIVKRGNYESTRNVDPSEFAQTNLRRAFSDAQSAADYRELADKLDAFARANNYSGANPLDLAGFAQRLRNVYPETVPETSAQGLFGGGIKGIAEKVIRLGKPDVTDQQKALKELLDFNSGAIPQTNGASVIQSRGSTPEALEDVAKAINSPYQKITPEHSLMIDEMLKKAPEADKYAREQGEQLAKEFGAKFIAGPIKKRSKVETNLVFKYQGDISRIADVVRNTIVHSNKAQASKIYETLLSNPNNKGKFVDSAQDPLGYTGWNVKVKAPNGLITETQVNTPKMIYAKEAEKDARAQLGDELYESVKKEMRGIEGGKGHKYYDQWFNAKNVGDLSTAEKVANDSKMYYSQFYD